MSHPRAAVLAAGGAALLMALHPVAVESVAWISEQKNTLSTVFYFGAALLFLRYREFPHPGRYLLATTTFLLALGTKTVTATLPAALLVVFWWQKGRLSWRNDVRPLLPWFGMALAAGLTTAWIERNLIGADGADYALSFPERSLLANRILWFYLGSFAWPADLAFFYERWDVPTASGGWWPYALLTVLFTVGLGWLSRRGYRGGLAIWLLWAGTLFPALGFFNVFPFAFSYVADHFQYLATFSLAGGLAMGITLLALRGNRLRQRILVACSLGVLGLLGVMAHRESRHYQNNIALFSASAATVPNNWMAQRCLAWAYSLLPDHDAESIQHYRASLALKPDSPDSLHGLAVVLLRDPAHADEAEALLRQAIALRPHFAEPHYLLALRQRNDPQRTAAVIDHLEIALQTRPEFAAAHQLLGDVLARDPSRQAEALHHFNEALRFEPELAAAHAGIGRLLASLPGRDREAESRLREALALDADLAAAHFELANLLARQPDGAEEAVTHYEAAIRLQPDTAGAHFNLANTLARFPDRMEEALQHYAEALKRQPDSAEILGNLGNAYGRLGRLAESLALYEEALRLDPSLGWLHQNFALGLSRLPNEATRAREHAREAVRLEPRNPAAHNTLALVYAQQNALEEARASWQRALQLDPNFAAARANLEQVNRLLQR
ncbi:tetratricopeptide repeat protein [Actomonas aquatica]|uniref:Tetratricopeptide repeat protein n=1 Tax=Actomonas aquatica TaxID=2866162 RepID=A0ABZ1C505_9BACT|nr:tetratricopeptide repeat protein [Opitutus sp. WL0086]WRQ86818.1 tetratricopeptide repeat protein [Opitutus sp. WL0086]